MSLYSPNFQKPKRLALYVRKSSESEDRQVLSIDSQIEVLMEYSAKNKFNIVKIFKDSASAHVVDNRPGFTSLMKSIEKGKIDGIVAWKTDRLARNPIEGGQIQYFLQKKKILLIATPHQCYTPQDSTLPLVFEFGVANQFSIDLSRNVKRGNATKLKNGGWCGVAPAGYLNDRINKTIIKDPERFHLIRKMFDLYLTQTHSIETICKIANKKWGYKSVQRKRSGGTPMGIGTLHQILKNPFYYGVICSAGIRSKGLHDPMITLQEHKQILKIMGRNHLGSQNNLKGENIVFAYTGLINCGECGSAITAEEKIRYNCPCCNKKHCSRHPKICPCGKEITQDIIDAGNHYTYYRCTKQKRKLGHHKCSQKCIRKNALESQLLQSVKAFTPSPKFKVWLEKALQEHHGHLFEIKEDLKTTHTNQIIKVDKKLHNLLQLTLDGGISHEEYIQHKKTLEEEKENIKYRIDQLDTSDTWKDDVITVSNFITNIPKQFSSLSNEKKKRLLKIIASNPQLTNRRLDLKWVEPLRILLALKRKSTFWLELEKPSPAKDIKDLKGLLKELYTAWQSQVEELRTQIDSFEFFDD